jgi:hypothetical protein
MLMGQRIKNSIKLENDIIITIIRIVDKTEKPNVIKPSLPKNHEMTF